MKELLANILHAANTDPPFGYSGQFYAIKERILTQYAESPVPVVQEIKKDCWQCDGTGIVEDDDCWKCDEGIYDHFFVRLDQYQLGNRTFLIPRDRKSKYEYAQLPRLFGRGAWPEPTIQGYIDHKRSKWNRDAHILLFLWCDRPTFWRFIRSSACYSKTPLAIIQRWDFFAGLAKKRAHKIISQWWTVISHNQGYSFEYECQRFWRLQMPFYQHENLRSQPWKGGNLDDIPF